MYNGYGTVPDTNTIYLSSRGIAGNIYAVLLLPPYVNTAGSNAISKSASINIT